MRLAGAIFDYRDRIPTYSMGGMQRIEEVDRDRNARNSPMLPWEEEILREPGTQEKRLMRLRAARSITG